jgi:branched-chain amino acid aminotransferase
MSTPERYDRPTNASQRFANHLAYFECESVGQLGWLPYDQVRLPVDDLGFRQGVTAVERLRTYNGQPFCVAKHLARFRNTLQLIHVQGAAEMPQWQGWINEILSRNSELLVEHGDVGITLWATPGSRGANENRVSQRPTIAVHLNPIDHAAVQSRRSRGQTVMLTEIVQPDAGSWSRHAKVRSRLHYYLADQLAREFSAIGVLQDTDGTWTESSVANIALVAHDEIMFAPSARVLQGITQAHIRELADELAIPTRELPLTTEMMIAADAMLLMGTDTGLWFADSVLDAQGKRLHQYAIPSADGVCSRLQALRTSRETIQDGL